MVKYAPVQENVLFAETPDNPSATMTLQPSKTKPAASTSSRPTSPTNSRGAEEVDEHPLLACLYKMDFGPAQVNERYTTATSTTITTTLTF